MQNNFILFLQLPLHPGSPGPEAQLDDAVPLWDAVPALAGRARAAPGDDVRLGSAEREDPTLPAGPHSTFNKEAKKEPLNDVVFQ